MNDTTTETRREAHAAILPTKAFRQRQVLDALRHFPDGATAEGVAALMGFQAFVTRPRLTELHGLGLVTVVGRAPSPTTGKSNAVYLAAPEAA